MSTTKFLNKDNEINSLVLDPSNNTAVVKNNDGDILVNYTNGTWAPTNKAPVDILKDSKQGGIFDSAFKSSYEKLSEVDQKKLSIYASKNNTNNTTVSNVTPKTISGRLSGPDRRDLQQQIRFDRAGFNDPDFDSAEGYGLKEGEFRETTINPPKDYTLKDAPISPSSPDPEGFYMGRYPINQKDTDNFDYLKITCYSYEPGLLLGGASSNNAFKIEDIDKRVKDSLGVISLPMQPGISESNSVGWGNNELNPLQVAGAGIAGAAMDAVSDSITNISGPKTGSGKDFFDLLGGSARFLLSAVDDTIIKQYFAGQAVGANLLGRTTGMTINNNVEVLFNSPNLRTFNYNYRFTPREPREAKRIREIIRFFKKQMAPKRSNNRIFLKSPNVWKLKYTFRNGEYHPFLNNIKICALNGFNVDYTPDGSYSTYDNEGGQGDGSMTSYQVSMSFMEMTPIYNDDFWTDDEGEQGTGF